MVIWILKEMVSNDCDEPVKTGEHEFYKIWEPSQNSSHQNGNMKQVPY